MVVAMNEINSPERQIIKLLAEMYPEFLKNLLDAVGTSFVNTQIKKPITSLFRKKEKKSGVNIPMRVVQFKKQE